MSSTVDAWIKAHRIPRRPRGSGSGGRLAVFKDALGWQVCYVARVDHNHVVWVVTVPGVTTDNWHGPKPFVAWEDAMAYAATLRTYYGDQCRGDNLLWNRRHPTRRA